MSPSDPRAATPALVLLSGGVDSATTLAIARAAGHQVYALSFDYGQRHRVELEAAKRIAASLGAREHRVFPLDLRPLGGSALTSDELAVPLAGTSEGVPQTYVPARNTIFLAVALAWAEVLGARDLFLGINAQDHAGYPDCRPEFLAAFQALANLATRAGSEGASFRVHAPLLQVSKGEILRRGHALGVDFGLTLSCYDPREELACGVCEACALRREGFHDAGLEDPTRYVAGAQ